MKKKILAVTIATALMVSCFTSCDNNTSSDSQVSQAESSTTVSADSTSSATDISSASDSKTSDSDKQLTADDMFSDRDLSGDYSECTDITLSDSTASCSDSSVTVADGSVTITKAGTYKLSGTFTGQIIVNAGDSDKVQLVLDNASITKEGSAALYIINADKVFITTVKGTENTLSSTGEFASSDDATNVDGAIFSKSDITFNGSGTLNVKCESKHGIVTKDDLKITGGTYNITSASQGLSGKDSVRIAGGNITVTSGTDGIHSENTDDTEKGYVYISGGTLNITSGKDCIDASGTVDIKDGAFTFKAGGGSSEKTTGDSTESYKGIKADGVLTISGGTLGISTGDDGIHSGNNTVVSGGEINIAKCYEGLEGQTVTVSGGKVTLTSSDDGINAAGGDNQGVGGGFGPDSFSADSEAKITITGGEIHVNASGDGLDSNGDIEISGGTVYVYGPTSNGNGSLDYENNAVITGGTVIMAGSSGMAMNFGSESTQGSILASTGNASAGTVVKLTDSSGNVIAEFTPTVSFQTVVISTPDITSDGTYTLTVGDSTQEITMSGYIYGSGMGGGFGGGQHGGNGGFGGGNRPGGNNHGSFGGGNPPDMNGGQTATA
ncbi:MAG: carbohydrate-binding domain-containing protein [[Eubacterium] siraeum]|nr:carbohydrate-binding domain-containing protein [[Eubacterium] siraeum]